MNLITNRLRQTLYTLAYAVVPEGLRLRCDAEHYGIVRFVEFCSGEVKPTDRVLDAGAGDCGYRRYFAHARYEATDYAWDYASQPNCPYAFSCSIDKIPRPDNTYDAIVSTQVLEHIEHPLKVLREFSRVLKPGGKLFLTAPQGWGVHMAPHHYFNFTNYGLESLFRQAGLSVVFVKPRGGIFWYLGNRIRALPNYVFISTRRGIRLLRHAYSHFM